jgi:hypothetical protein
MKRFQVEIGTEDCSPSIIESIIYDALRLALGADPDIRITPIPEEPDKLPLSRQEQIAMLGKMSQDLRGRYL